jgi:hypothetical protein
VPKFPSSVRTGPPSHRPLRPCPGPKRYQSCQSRCPAVQIRSCGGSIEDRACWLYVCLCTRSDCCADPPSSVIMRNTCSAAVRHCSAAAPEVPTELSDVVLPYMEWNLPGGIRAYRARRWMVGLTRPSEQPAAVAGAVAAASGTLQDIEGMPRRTRSLEDDTTMAWNLIASRASAELRVVTCLDGRKTQTSFKAVPHWIYKA